MMLGQPATGEDFCGRRQELDDLWRYLENEHIRFPGVRRLGKTSILKRLQEQAAEQGVLARWLDVSHIHIRHIWPLPKNLGELLKSYDKIIVPEMNTGQLKTVLRDQYLVDARPLNKVSGQPFKIAEIEAAIEGALG